MISIFSHNLAPGTNVLAVQVFAETQNDLGLDFIDWNPEPADKNPWPVARGVCRYDGTGDS